MHFVFLPLSLVHLAIWPSVLSETRNLIVPELPSVSAGICESETAIPMLLSIFVGSFVLGAIWPLLNSFSMLLILVPVSNIGSSIGMLVGSMAMSLIIEPLTLIDISVGMDQSSVPIRLVSQPLPIVFGSVLPDLLAIAVFHSIE